MTYPLSSAVSADDATLADHYNNLRLDSLYGGQAITNAIALRTLLERFESRLTIEKLTADTLRVPASASAPVSLMIDGYQCQAVANVDLAGGDAPSGAAAAYYIFANRADDSTSFTLSVNTVSTQQDNQRRIGRFYWDGAKIIKDSVRSEFADLVNSLTYFIDPQICMGRLSLSTGVPVPTSDIASSSSLFFTPDKGDRVALYVKDYGWRLYQFSELTLDISGISSGVNYDIWLYDNEGTLTLASTAWSNATLRATALTRQDGVLVKSGSLTHRYLGTIRGSGAGVSCDMKLKRFVWNFYNQRVRNLEILAETDAWTYATINTWRQWNADSAHQVEFVIGYDESPVILTALVSAANPVAQLTAYIGIGLDKTNNTDAALVPYCQMPTVLIQTMNTYYNDYPGIGYHYLALVEWVAVATVTFYGDAGGAVVQSGATGFMMG